MIVIAVDGSAANGKCGFGICSDKIKITSPVKDFILSGISYPTIFYDETSPQNGTNNRAELLGMLYCLHYIETLDEDKYTIICDSQYVINTITIWFPTRLMKGTEREVLNYDIISILYEKSIEMSNKGYTIIYKWQKAHQAQYKINALPHEEKVIAMLNKQADELAKEGYKYEKPTILRS